MRTPRIAISSVRLLASTCCAAALLTGCGGDSTDEKATSPAAGGSSTSAVSGAEASTLAVPSGGPGKITEFPIPGGAKIVDTGPAFNKSWTFGISSPDTAAVVAFYKKALTDERYTVKENVTLANNANNIEYDLAFFGETYGVVDESDLTGGTQVTVNDQPIRGLEP